MTSRRPLTPLGYVVAPLAFWLTHVVRPVFDAIRPEPTKYKYRVDRTDAEPAPPVAGPKACICHHHKPECDCTPLLAEKQTEKQP